MLLSGVLRWSASNALCMARIVSLLSLVYGLRTVQLSQNLRTLPAQSILHGLRPSTAWLPLTSRASRGAFVGLGQAGAPDGPTDFQPQDLETAHHEQAAVIHEASEKMEHPQSTSEKSKAEKVEGTRHEEVSTEVHEVKTRESDEDTILGRGKTPEELTEEDLHHMTPREGLVALLSQGKDLVAEVKGALNGIDAVVSLGKVTDKIRDEIQKDVQALNRTIVEEFENIEHLRQLQDAQTAVLRSQLSFLMPKHPGLSGHKAEMVKASGEKSLAVFASLWYLTLVTVSTIGAALMFDL